MKNLRNSVLTLLLAGSLLAACSGNRNVTGSGNRTDDAAEQAGEKIDNERAELKDEIQEGIDKIDRRLEKLRAEAKDASGDTKDNLDKQVNKLENSRQRLSGFMSRLGSETKEGWQKLKADVRSAFDEVKDDIRD
ncbi:MAG: major capsid protein [Cytophagales bacterium]|jgi:archaellum component FlaC|nr:major capsid protein [Cytophagales bacterium]